MTSISLGITGARKKNGKLWTGDEHYNEFKTALLEWIATNGMPDKMISGGAVGADTHARRFAEEHDIEFVEHLPYKHLRSPQKFYRRNEDIVNDSTHIVAFPSDIYGRDWEYTRGGTQWTMRYAMKQGVEMHIFWVEDLV